MSAMQYRVLGSTGLRVSALGLGCSSLGGGVFYRDDAQSLRVLSRAFDRGVTFYDTADTYGYGHSERLIGRALKAHRREIVIASKVGFLPSSLARFGRMALPVVGPFRRLLQPWKQPLHRASTARQDFSPAHIARAIEGSLKRLGTDYVDLYLLHSPPPSVLEEGRAFEVLDRLKREGKIRFYGVSAQTSDDALLALRHPGVSALQVVFNALDQDAATRVFPIAALRQAGLIARIPLGRGLLTDAGVLQTGCRYEVPDTFHPARQVLESLTRAGQRAITQVALQFVLQHPDVSTAIPGTRSVQHLEENLRALDAPPLTTQDVEHLTRARCLTTRRRLVTWERAR